jgi:hypothetical protein
MTQNTEQWMIDVDNYIVGVRSAFGEWEAQMKAIEEETIGPDLDSLKTKTEGITEASDALTEAITEEGGLLDSLESEYNDVVELTGAYASLREQILEAIGARE